MNQYLQPWPTEYRVYYKVDGKQCFHGYPTLKRARFNASRLTKEPDIKKLAIIDRGLRVWELS